MPSFDDNVYGCALDVERNISPILFPTSTDALLASLIVRHADVPMELFDDFLAILRHPEFIPKDVTMARTEDYIEHIAEQWIAAARDRGNLQVKHLGGIPQVIVDLVADQLNSERIPFHHLILRTFDSSSIQCEAEKTLQTMALVHRSWTISAQRCLRRRIHALTGLFSKPKLRSLLQAPLLGPWVRELCIKFPPPSPPRKTHRNGPDDFHPIDEQRLISQIIRRCPYLKVLYVEAFNVGEWVTGSVNISSDFFEHLSRLQCLEKLWLHRGTGEGNCKLDIGELCTVLPHLRSLKVLSLKGWNPHSFKEINKRASNRYSYPPMAQNYSLSLKVLSLVEVSNTNLLALLGKACEEHPPEAMELSFCDIRREIEHYRFCDPLPFLAPILPSVTKLVLHSYEPDDDIISVLEEFPSLRSLCIYLSDDEAMPDDSCNMPDSIRIVHFHYDCRPGDDQERFVLSTLKASPHIRRLVVTSTHVDEFEPFPDYEGVFEATRDYCRENKVELVIKWVEVKPSYNDI